MADVVYTTTFQFKRGLKSSWATKNPTLVVGEPGFEYDTGKLKIGDGIQAWNDLEYINQPFKIVDSYSYLPAIANAEDMIYVCEDTKSAYVPNDERTEWLKISGSGSGGTINTIKVNGTVLDIVDNAVNIPAASASVAGVVYSNTDVNGVSVTNGQMQVNNIGVEKLVNNGNILILDCNS